MSGAWLLRHLCQTDQHQMHQNSNLWKKENKKTPTSIAIKII